MTKEEAIAYLTPIMEGRDYHQEGKDAAALKLAIDALRAQQTPAKLDRSRWEVDACCCKQIITSRNWVVHGKRYCPYCGRLLTEEAWAELERRIF